MTPLRSPCTPSLVWGDNPLMSTEFFLTVGLLVAVLLAGAVVFFFVDRWRKRQLAPDRESADSLTMFRSMYERGELTEEEYRKVRDRVASRMREEVTLPVIAPTPPHDAPGPPPENPPKDQNSPLT